MVMNEKKSFEDVREKTENVYMKTKYMWDFSINTITGLPKIK